MSTEGMLTGQQLEVPKSTVGVFTLPCGYIDPSDHVLHTEVQLREIRGREEDMLNSRKVPGERKLSILLSSCIERLGTITSKDKIRNAVEEMPTGDRVFLMFCLRRLSIGDDLPVRETCPNRRCNANNFYVIDTSELKTKTMPEPEKRTYDVTLPSGSQVRFRVSTGHDEVMRTKIRTQNKTEELSLAMLMRIETLNSEKPTLSMIADMSLRDRLFLRNLFEKVEGGIDLEVELSCPKCEHEWKKNLELSPDFFSLSET
jgi:hypothetical protein